MAAFSFGRTISGILFVVIYILCSFSYYGVFTTNKRQNDSSGKATSGEKERRRKEEGASDSENACCAVVIVGRKAGRQAQLCSGWWTVTVKSLMTV